MEGASRQKRMHPSFYPKIYTKPQAGQTMHNFQAKTVKMRLTSLQIQ